MTAIERLKNAQTTDNNIVAPTASAIDRLQAAQTTDSGIRVKAPSSSAIEKASQARATALAREAENRTFLDRAKDTFAGWKDRAAASYAGAAENLLEITRDLDTRNSLQNKQAAQAEKNAAHYREMLGRGTWDNGKAITAEEREWINAQIKDAEQDAKIYREGNEAIHKPISNVITNVEDYGDRKQAASDKALARAKEGASKAGQIAIDVGTVAGDIAADAAANVVVPGLGTATRVARMYGQGAEAAEDKDFDLGTQMLYGAGSAALGEASNRLFNSNPILQKAFGKGALDDMVFPGLDATRVGRMVKGAAGEAFEEAGENVLDKGLQAILFGEERDKLDLKDVGYDALLASIVGAGTGAVSSAPRNAAQKPSGTIEAASAGNKTPQNGLMEINTLYANKNKGTPSKLDAENAAPNSTPEAMEPVPSDINVAQSANPVKADSGANVENAVGANAAANQTDYDRLQAQSTEFYPEGANADPNKHVDMPVKDFDGKTISRFASNVVGAQGVTRETVETVEQMVANGVLSDDVLHNTDALAQAEAEINKIGIDGAMEKLRQAAARKETSPQLIAMMEALLIDAEAASTRNEARSAELVLIGAELSRSAARSTQLLSYLRKMSPTYQLQAIRSSISNYVSKEIEESAEWKALEQNFLNAPDVNTRNAAISDMQQYVADNIKQSMGNKVVGWFTALRYMNMLGNLKTPTRNIIGNITNRAIYMVDNAAIAGAEKLLRGKHGRTRSAFVSPELAKLGKADADNVAAKLFDGGKYTEGTTAMSANDFMRGVEAKRKTFGDIDLSKFGGKSYSNPLEKAKTAIDWVMNNKWFGDEAFLRSGYGRFLAGYLKANNVTAEQWNDPAWQKANAGFVEKARNNSVRLAKEAAFRQDNVFSEWVGKVGRRPDTPWYGRMIAEGVAPFRKTPANVALEILEHSPAGYASAVIKGVEAKLGAVDKNGEARADATDVIEGLAKATSGSVLMGVGALLYSMGYLTGGANEDDEQAAFDDLIGKQDYAIQLDDGRSFTVDWLTPVATPFVMGAEMMKRANGDANGWETLINVLTSMSDPFLETSFVSGIRDAIDEAKYSESSAEQIAFNAILNYLTQGFTSTIGGQLERTFQKDSMMTYVDKNKAMPDFLQKAIGKATAKGLGDYNQIPYIDVWGEKESEDDFFVRAFNNLVNPAYASKTEMDATEQELQRLYDSVGGQYGRVFPDRADKSIEVSKSVYDPLLGKEAPKKEMKNLTADEYVKYAQAKGRNSKQLVDQAVKSLDYRSMNDAQKAKLLSKMYEYANYKAKKEIIPTFKDDEFAKYEKAESLNMSPAEYYAMTQSYDYDHSSSTGQPTKEEAQRYLDTETNLSRSQKADMWVIINKSWEKNNPYK